jgi:RNA polymerase sigma-70 factor (ECF subfamily)
MRARDATLEAVESIYRTRGEDFFRLALARTSNPDLAHEAVQEGFARAIRARARYRGFGSLEAWVCRCILNAAKDSWRRSINLEFEETGSMSSEPSSVRADVRAAIRQLPARQRDVLFLRFYLDLEYPAIAEVLGVAVGTVSATLHTARKALVHSLEEVSR